MTLPFRSALPARSSTRNPTAPGSSGFSIEVIDDPASEDGLPPSSGAVGRITVGGFTETFSMDLGLWSVDAYRRSWEAALRELGRTATATSCLIASLTDPATADFVFCWPMYRDGEVVHVQNAVIFLDELDGPFDPREPWRSVRSRCPVDEDGNRVSEWVTSASRVRRFLERTWGP